MEIERDELYYEIKGSGTPILCLSGFASTGYNYHSLKLNGKMIILDNRGMGKSPNSLNSYSIQTLAQDACELMLSLGYKKFHVCGISMGGFIATECALLFPELVKSLSLLCTTSGGDDFVTLPYSTADDMFRFYSQDNKKISEALADITVHNEKLKNSIANIRQQYSPADPFEVVKQKKAVDTYLSHSHPLEKIKCPTYILTGDNDRYVNPENSLILSKKIKNSKADLISEADHMFFLEKPEEVSLKVSTFIEGVES